MEFFLAINKRLTASVLLALMASFLWGMISTLFYPC